MITSVTLDESLVVLKFLGVNKKFCNNRYKSTHSKATPSGFFQVKSQ